MPWRDRIFGRHVHRLGLMALVMFAAPTVAMAGMPSYGLSDTALFRVNTISFFLVGLLLSAGVVRWGWNSFQTTFPRLPRITYAKSCGVVVLWGLLFVIVLTMISGARELMTPGAWVKNGATYQLRDTAAKPPAENPEQLARRKAKLQLLAEQLKNYAQAHSGKFPATEADAPFSPDLWRLDDIAPMRYVYVPGLTQNDRLSPLAYEPQSVEGIPLVLFASGEIRRIPIDALVSLRPQESAP